MWSAGNRRGSQSGFTLLELLIVLALLGLMLALVPPSFSGRLQSLNVRGAALELADTLREARSRALFDNRPTWVELTAAPDYRADNAERATTLPDTAQIDFRADASLDWRMLEFDDAPLRLRFYPDGSSAGGELRLRDQGRVYVVAVDWLLGRVSLSADAGGS